MVVKRNKILKPSERKKGKQIKLLDMDISEAYAKNLFGNGYKKIFDTLYQAHIEKPNGDKIHIGLDELKTLNVGKLNPRSYRPTNLMKADPKNANEYHLKDNAIFKAENSTDKVIITKNTFDALEKADPNEIMTYDIYKIETEIRIQLSGGYEPRKLDFSKKEITRAIKILKYDKKITKPQCRNILNFLINEWVKGFGENVVLSVSPIYAKFYEVGRIRPLTLEKNGEKYYLKNDIQHYKNMMEHFEYENILVKEGENCVINTLEFISTKQEYINKVKKEFNKQLSIMKEKFIKNEEIPTYKTLIELLDNVKINYSVFNWLNKTDSKTNYTDETMKRRKMLYFIIYDNHLYLLKSKDEYQKIKNCVESNDKYIILEKNEFNNKLNNLLKNNIDINLRNIKKNREDVEISSFKYNGDVYVLNDDDNTPKNLLYLSCVFGISYNEFITPTKFISHLINELEIKNEKSLFLYNHTSKDMIFNKETSKPKNLITIDLNLCYTNILRNLDEIPIINNLVEKTSKYEGEEINNNYLYNIKVFKDNIFFKNSDVYFGKYINEPTVKPYFLHCIENNEIEVIDKIGVKWIKNIYQPIIYKIFETIKNTNNNNNLRKTAKQIINCLIGNFNNKTKENTRYETEFKLVKNNTASLFEEENLEHYRYDDDYIITSKYIEKYNNTYHTLESHKPLRTLIINSCWLKIGKLIIDNKIDEDDIYQINIDSITFMNQNNKYNDFVKEITEEEAENTKHFNLRGLKIAPYKGNKTTSYIGDNNISFIEDLEKSMYENKFEVFNGYAGCGKSFKIEKFYKSLDDVIIIAPLRKVLKLYPNDINKDTVQHFTRNNKMPSERNIIIDEAYLINNADFKHIINWYYQGKNIYLYGDYKQLPPIEITKKEDKQLLNIEFLKTISTNFNEYNSDEINRRNNFSFEIYDKLIENEYSYLELLKIITYMNKNCDETKDHKLICYTNKTKDRINEEKMKLNGQEFNKDKISGVDIPLISNNNFKVGNYDICSKDEFNLKCKDDKYYLICKDDNLKELEITEDKLLSNFTVCYAYTLYSIQGQTFDNYKFIEDDIYFLSKNNEFSITGALYTIFSRYKAPKISEKKITYQEFKKIYTYVKINKKAKKSNSNETKIDNKSNTDENNLKFDDVF